MACLRRQALQRLIVRCTAQDFYGVGKKMGDGFEGFECAFGAAGKIDDEGLAADGGDSSGKSSGGSFLDALAANFFGDAGNRAVGDFEGGFGTCVAWTKTGAAGSQENICAARIGDGAELLANFGRIIGAMERRNYGPAEFFAMG
jgi:hypothetical protein